MRRSSGAGLSTQALRSLREEARREWRGQSAPDTKGGQGREPTISVIIVGVRASP